jgi:hypothetical protein
MEDRPKGFRILNPKSQVSISIPLGIRTKNLPIPATHITLCTNLFFISPLALPKTHNPPKKTPENIPYHPTETEQ